MFDQIEMQHDTMAYSSIWLDLTVYQAYNRSYSVTYWSILIILLSISSIGWSTGVPIKSGRVLVSHGNNNCAFPSASLSVTGLYGIEMLFIWVRSKVWSKCDQLYPKLCVLGWPFNNHSIAIYMGFCRRFHHFVHANTQYITPRPIFTSWSKNQHSPLFSVHP